MNEPTIAQTSPIEVEVEQGKSFWWCACGLSAKQPFCDGSHTGSGFTPIQYTAEESGKKWFCACKRSKNGPLCDGTHKALK